MPDQNLEVCILSAGMGTRMRSNRPKALQKLANSLTNKMLHGPTIEMRKALKSDDQETIRFLQSLISPE